MSDIPVWDTDSIYKGFDDPHYLSDKNSLKTRSAKLLRLLEKLEGDSAQAKDAFVKWILLYDQSEALAEQLFSYASMLYTVDTNDQRAVTEMGDIEERTLPLQDALVAFREIWAASPISFESLVKKEPSLKPFKRSLQEDRIWAQHQMSRAEESLANDLSRSGADAWGRLQQSVSANLSVVWDAAAEESKTVTELRSLASSPDRSIRKKAFDLELSAWKSVEIPLAASLNGVKGAATTLSKRRGWKSQLELSALQSRFSVEALEAMIGVMTESLPQFRRYLKAKAKALSVERCAFYDLFAPVGKSDLSYTWQQAQDLVVSTFSAFSKPKGEFARVAFEKNWIHARAMEGKVGGAYCTSLPLSQQPRILSNFDGSFGEVKTLAHELGHGWHFWLLKDELHVYHNYPMTLAETASIFAETIVYEETVKNASASTALFLIEQNLQDATQVIVDILSRFLFEKNVFDRRSKSELSASEFGQLMLQAQKDTYGDALDEHALHPYMWAVKGHYYSAGLAFYNYPYAFGQLFSLALYNQYRNQGPSFARDYEKILRSTGIHTADKIAEKAGFDLKKPDFWRQGMQEIERQISEFERRVHEL